MLAERNKNPRVVDGEALEWLAAYIVTTRAVGLRFLPGPAMGKDLSKPAVQHSYADATWNSSDDGASRLSRSLYHGEFPEEGEGRQGEVTAPFFAKSGKEKGTSSTSVAQAELKSAVLATGDIHQPWHSRRDRGSG